MSVIIYHLFCKMVPNSYTNEGRLQSQNLNSTNFKLFLNLADISLSQTESKRKNRFPNILLKYEGFCPFTSKIKNKL